MRQLSGVDASFLHIEDARTTGHVSGLIIIDPSTAGRPVNADTVRQHIAQRIHLLAPMRWRLVQVPLGIDLPYWIDDPDLDLDFHVRGIALPRPGTDEQLAEQVSRLVARPLDRAHPLWELYVIEGLQGDRVAILTKLHHAAIDGKTGMKIFTTIVSQEPDSPPPPQPDAPLSTDSVPTELEMWTRGWLGVMGKPEKGLRMIGEMTKEAQRHTAQLMSGERPAVPQVELGEVPRLPFNKLLTTRRTTAFGSLSLSDVKAVRAAHGCTVNDVVMAVCAGALRRWLQAHEALPDGPIKVMVPVSTRTGPDDGSPSGGNQVSGMVADLPTHLGEPLERLAEAHEIMRAAKEKHAAVPARLLQDFAQFTAPAASEFVAKTAAQLRLAERMPLPFNLVISNVPGPREPLYYAGGLVEKHYPVSMINDGLGLNITVQSYRDQLDFGLVSCPELIPDLWSLIDYLRVSLEELVDR